MARTALASRYAPRRLPFGLVALWWLLLDRVGIPAWGWGVFWTLAGILAVVSLIDVFTAQERTPVWERVDV